MSNSSNKDPRFRNEMFNWSSIESYKSEYATALGQSIDSVSTSEVEAICQKVHECSRDNGQVLVAGNGGSAAIAEHLCCDWTKGTNCVDQDVITTRSLTSNIALYSAVANDFGFEHVFDSQIEFFGRPGDILVAISSSGNSPNVLNAVARAKERGIFVAGFAGFDGGRLMELADAKVYVRAYNYGIVEDAHQAIMHIIAQYIASQRDNPPFRADQ